MKSVAQQYHDVAQTLNSWHGSEMQSLVNPGARTLIPRHGLQEADLQAENDRLKMQLAQRKARDEDAQKRLKESEAAVEEMVRNNAANAKLLQVHP